jgi:hypothetical protein
MFISCDQNARKNHNIKTANKSDENVVKLKYFRMVLTNQNCIHEETESRLNSGIPLYHSVENLWSFNFPYQCKTLSLTLRKEHRLRVFENMVLRRMFGYKGEKVKGRMKKTTA